MISTRPCSRRQKKAWGSLWIPAILVLGLSLAPEKPEDVPNPRRLNGTYVQDNGRVLGPEYISLVNSICRNLKAATGAELAVVTVANLGGISIEEFADKLFRLYGIGEKGKDNGLLLLFARDDRAARIEVGYGLEALIPDARSGRILDEQALPDFRKGLIGRGLYLAAKEMARAVAAAANVQLADSDPPAWPAQVDIPTSGKKLPAADKGRLHPLTASLLLAAAAIGLVGLDIFIMLLRLRKARAKTDREKVIANAGCITGLMWIVAFAGLIVAAAFSGRFLPPLIAFLTAPAAATFGQARLRKGLRRRLLNYHMPCRKCGQGMDLLPEAGEHRVLSVEENAEEKAGGMDYELWQCSHCGESERVATKLIKADKCPKCSRRTLTSSRTILVAATTRSGGRVRVTDTCQNPNCGYIKSEERQTPRLSSGTTSSSGSSFTSGSHSSSSSHSSSGSFGGGRSGGGGASRSW